MDQLYIGGEWWSDLPSVPDSETHFARNDLNTDLPKSPIEANKAGWIELTPFESRYHMQGIDEAGRPNTGNRKFVSEDGLREVVFNQFGEIVTDEVNKGTYNFSPPTSYGAHFIEDMLPYYAYGNSPDDPTNPLERTLGIYGGNVNITQTERDLAIRPALQEALEIYLSALPTYLSTFP